MAYVPPHMRKNKGGAGASSPLSPVRPPESMIPRHCNPDIKSEKYPKKIVQAENAISTWFVVGLADENRVSSLAHLEPVAMESFEQKFGEKPLALVLKENGEEVIEFSENPWIDAVEAVKQDLFASFELVKNEMRNCQVRETKQSLVLCVGRILFQGSRSFPTESIKESSLPVSTLKQVRRFFNTNAPPLYMEHITSNVVPQIDSDSEKDRELYYVECTFVKERNQLEHSKIELNQVCHLAADMSCLGKDMDLRLILNNKRVLVELTEEELECIGSLVSSAELHSKVVGGLRWRMGKQTAGNNRFKVVGYWHTNATTYYINSSTRLRLRKVDRFDLQTSRGEADVYEAVLKLPGIASQLQADEVKTELVLQMLEENLRLIWKHFLNTK